MKTFVAKPDSVTHNWYVVDAEGQVLGRLASEIAKRLRGKHKPEYTPHIDTGDYIVVVNATKIRVTGNKRSQGLLFAFSYPGGLKEAPLEELLATPHRVIERPQGHVAEGLWDAQYRKSGLPARRTAQRSTTSGATTDVSRIPDGGIPNVRDPNIRIPNGRVSLSGRRAAQNATARDFAGGQVYHY